jgi:DNA-binding CsgD family transcriptional regulator
LAVHAPNIRRTSEHGAPQSLADRAGICARADILDAAIALEREAQLFGVRLMVWPDLATFEPMLDADGEPVNTRVFGWACEQITRCQSLDNAARTRLLRICRTNSDWCDVSWHDIGSPESTCAIAAMDRGDGLHGLCFDHAVMVPVLLPFGQFAAAFIVKREPRLRGPTFQTERFAASATDAIRRFIAGYVRLTQDQRYLPPDTVLSQREVECLGWVAHGKTDFEISLILGCSHAGVRYHLTRACTKLDANNRAQAVFRAGQLGLISPSFAALQNEPRGS